MSTSSNKGQSKKEVASKALALALSALQSESVQNQLKRAPEAVMNWAREASSRPSSGRIRAGAQRLNPAARLGQRGLERRLENVTANVTLAFGENGASTRPEVWAALAEVQQAVEIAASMPTVKRKKMHRRIDEQLDALENALIDAILPKT